MNRIRGKFGEWTPIEEGAPENYGEYLITTKKGFVMVAKLHSDMSSWGLPKSMKVVAWMPKPKPYREKR